jgi:host factor-I protein
LVIENKLSSITDYPLPITDYPLPNPSIISSLSKMAITDFDTSLPSIRQVQSFIKQAAAVELKLLTGDLITGRILWQDPNCLCIADENSRQIIISKPAIAYFHAKG